MKGGFGCSPCCKGCEVCTRTCVEPHTGDPFDTAYTLFFEGVEAGNPDAVILTAEGEVDTSDPYDGMDGNGPWSQTVYGSVVLSPSTTRFPCSFRASFWRSSFVLGPNTNPPPSLALTTNEIIVTNDPSSTGPIVTGVLGADDALDDVNLVLYPGESRTYTGIIPLVPGAGDQSDADPRQSVGSIEWRALCGNDTVTISVDANIGWNTKQRQHVLYGLVRECYEDAGPCDTECDGDPPPDIVYLTISNYRGPVYDAGTPMDIEGTYVLEREPGFCNYYWTYWTSDLCISSENPLGSLVWGQVSINSYGIENHGFYMAHYAPVGGKCGVFELFPPDETFSICGSGVLFTGTNGKVRVDKSTVTNSAFDWKIEVL